MMWGSWAVLDNPPQEIDRRERSRIVVPDACAILYSAPIFDLGAGNPFEILENLCTLGTDILPYPDEPRFNGSEFLQKLVTPENSQRTIGAALLDQQIVAGIGNYLRAEILFNCRLDPWRKIADLTADELQRLIHSIPLMAQRAYATGGFTVSDEARTRLQNDPSLVYTPGSEYGTRHFVFRRTNLPCLVCGSTIRQLRQVTKADEEGEKTRIIYFCPTCQETNVELKKSKSKRKVIASNEKNIEVQA
jgi:formamidopyrimidine-DNA glycosylase